VSSIRLPPLVFAAYRKEEVIDIVKITVNKDIFSRKVPRLATPTPFYVITVR